MNTALASSIREIKLKLADSNSLDGTPYLTLVDKGDGVVRMFGCWPTLSGTEVYGYRSSDLCPDNLCGSVQSSREVAQKRCAELNDLGVKAYYQHWRAFLEQRLAAQQNLLDASEPTPAYVNQD